MDDAGADLRLEVMKHCWARLTTASFGTTPPPPKPYTQDGGRKQHTPRRVGTVTLCDARQLGKAVKETEEKKREVRSITLFSLHFFKVSKTAFFCVHHTTLKELFPVLPPSSHIAMSSEGITLSGGGWKQGSTASMPLPSVRWMADSLRS